MTVIMSELPIESLLPDIAATLQASQKLILGAPPGAGKTTRVPLALAGLISGFDPLPGRIIMLEPRRIAARMAAERMASTLNQNLGEQVGLTTRFDHKVSKQTVIEVVTDGVFTRRILSDPELSGVSAVIFDEIHERGLNADIDLALALESQAALREDLHLLAMSATLDTAEMAARLKAPVIESGGRQYPIETRYLGRSNDPLETQMARAIERAARETDGSVLAFLPGTGEIRRTADRLDLPENFVIAPLYGALSPKDQDTAIRPCPSGRRKVVLATDIAESALTIEGVSVVVDSGYSRVPKFSPGSVRTELQTVRAALANVDQRRGRAGRLGPGTCYRLWSEPENRGLLTAPVPEIQNADLAGLYLTLAEWGEPDPTALTWLTPPSPGRLEAARQDLIALGAIDQNGVITATGSKIAKLPLPPRLAALIVGASSPGEKALAAQIAALVSERGFGGDSADLSDRLRHLQRDARPRAKQLRHQAARWAGSERPEGDPAIVLASGWPDMIAKKRSGSLNQYLLASGQAGQIDPDSALAKSDWLVVADMTGSSGKARISLAATLEARKAESLGHVSVRETADFDPSKGSFQARRVTSMGAITLSSQPLPKPSASTAKAAFLTYLETEGFSAVGLEETVRQTVARITCLRGAFGDPWPQWTLENLQSTVRDWLGGRMPDETFTIPKPSILADALIATLEWPLPQELSRKAPTALTLPSRRKARIDWLDERAPLIECKAQELFGLTTHPSIADGRVAVTLQILSPGGKPTATTQDLPRFWTDGYRDMVKDMRGRYPKHDWPDDPGLAAPHAGLTKARLNKR